MSKIESISDELNSLLVKRSIEHTDEFDDQIKTLQAKQDFFNWGIREPEEPKK